MDYLKYLPIIEFEINYSVAGYSLDFAQKVIDEYSIKYGYNHINLVNTRGDGLLVPRFNE